MFSDGSVLDSIENIAPLNADNVMTGTNTLTGDVKIISPRRRVSTQTGHWWSGRRWYSRIYGSMDGRYLTIWRGYQDVFFLQI
jgi:hypothetical protein